MSEVKKNLSIKLLIKDKLNEMVITSVVIMAITITF